MRVAGAVVPAFAAAVLAGMFVGGCSEPPAWNPWRDDSIPASEFGTASSSYVFAANQEPALRVRDYPETSAPVVRKTVPHWPLWWEDPFEDQGDNNDEFAWTWQDYFHMPYGLGRFMVNTMGWPVSAVVTPPGTPMVSDGVVEKVHDAQRGVSPNPTAGPEDFEEPANGQEVPLEPLPVGSEETATQPAA
jgi:hypothetical protein